MNVMNFAFNSQAVRVIAEDVSKPLFVARDVAALLGYKDTAKAVRTHCKRGSQIALPSKGGMQQTIVIPEADVWRLVMRSELPEAEAFQDWVCETVLPELRTNGGYVLGQESLSPELLALQQEANRINRRAIGLQVLLLSKPMSKATAQAIRETLLDAAKVAEALHETEPQALSRAALALNDKGLNDYVKSSVAIGSHVGNDKVVIDLSDLPNRFRMRHA